MSNARLIIPDPPNLTQQQYSGNQNQKFSDITSWCQKVKGNLYTQSAGFAPLITTSGAVVASGISKISSDGNIAYGYGTYTSGTDGSFSIVHGLNNAPNFAEVRTLGANTSAYIVNVNTLGTSSLSCKLVSSTGTVNSTAFGVMFHAIV